MKKYLLFLSLLLVSIGNAQNPGDVAQIYGDYNGFNNPIYKITLQPDGKILIGGFFTNYKGVTENCIVRLNPDGSKDTSFITGTGFDDQINEVNSIAVQNDGKILVGGSFTTYQGVTENCIIRLNPNGSKDTSFITGTGFNGGITSIVLQSDNKILIGGVFTTYKGVAENNIIRINADGSKDTSFTSGNGFIGGVTSMVLQNDGKIILGGGFSSYQGVTENKIIRLNSSGTKDTSFITGTGFNGGITSIVLQSDNKILIVGGFNSYQEITFNKIIRLNTDGSIDNNFNIGVGFNAGVNSIPTGVNEIALQNDGKILAGGSFRYYQGLIEIFLLRLNSDGSKHTSFYSGTGFVGGGINDMALQSDGKILVGGNFIKYKGLEENKFIRLNTDGSKDTSFNTGIGFENSVSKIVIQSDGKILVGGPFGSYQGLTVGPFVRLNTDGSRDTSFITGTSFNTSVTAIALQNDGKILVGGDFGQYQGVNANKIIRLNSDGSRDSSFSTGTGAGFNGSVYTITLQSDGKILVGGLFTTYRGVNQKKLVRLNTDGSIDNTFNIGSGFSSFVNSIVIQNDGKILVGGSLYSYQGVTIGNLVRLNADGSIDNSFNINTGFNSEVHSIALQNDGKIIVVGNFNRFQGLLERFILRLNIDGSKDTSFITGSGFNGTVKKVVLQNDGKILVGGWFWNYQVINESSSLIKLNGNSSLVTNSVIQNIPFNIYPNPAKDQITIDFSTNSNAIGVNYKIKNMLGQEVQNGDLNSQQNTIELSSIKEQGIYFVKIYDNSNSLLGTKKIIIQQ